MSTTVDTAQRTATATTDQSGRFALAQLQSITSLPPNAAIVDDVDAGFVRYGSPAGWHDVSGPTNYYYLGHMYWTSNTYSLLDNYAIWTPALTSGLYQVYAFIDWDNATTQQARYQIIHNGQTTVYTLNQNIYYAVWVSLGTYAFGNAPGSNYVRLEDVTSEAYLSRRVGFDAIAFVPVRVHLPVVLKNYPPPIKTHSGLHLGSRATDPTHSGWTEAMLQPIDGDKGGKWPTSIVVLSNQVYNLGRPSDPTPDNPLCRISNVMTFTQSYTMYDYMQRASANGVKVLTRINPSPGNFADWDDPLQQNHHLLSSGGPAGGIGYCADHKGHENQVRHIGDIVQEIAQIHGFNVRNGLWEYAFVPANEPNREWYTSTIQESPASPKINDPVVWREMDSYFSKLYQQVHTITPPPDLADTWGVIRLLTPPMAQERFAEGIDILDDANPNGCSTGAEVRLTDMTSGYENMITTFQTANDGIAWHNYWRYGYEWTGGCEDYGDHLYSMVYPTWLREYMRTLYHGNLNFIIEADLASPAQMQGKSTLKDKNADPSAAAQSVRQFFFYESAMVNAWLLSYEDVPGQFDAEIHWHEAYSNTAGMLPWFPAWWNGSERPW